MFPPYESASWESKITDCRRSIFLMRHGGKDPPTALVANAAPFMTKDMPNITAASEPMP
jgi:hypothetical protein